jgi:hypothetical protein
LTPAGLASGTLALDGRPTLAALPASEAVGPVGGSTALALVPLPFTALVARPDDAALALVARPDGSNLALVPVGEDAAPLRPPELQPLPAPGWKGWGGAAGNYAVVMEPPDPGAAASDGWSEEEEESGGEHGESNLWGLERPQLRAGPLPVARRFPAAVLPVGVAVAVGWLAGGYLVLCGHLEIELEIEASSLPAADAAGSMGGSGSWGGAAMLEEPACMPPRCAELELWLWLRMAGVAAVVKLLVLDVLLLAARSSDLYWDSSLAQLAADRGGADYVEPTAATSAPLLLLAPHPDKLAAARTEAEQRAAAVERAAAVAEATAERDVMIRRMRGEPAAVAGASPTGSEEGP